MDLLWKDIRYALHSLRANPGFALVSILTLALGIGATTAIFSVVNGVLLQPLPLHEPDRVVTVWEKELDEPGSEPNVVSPANFTEWLNQSKRVFSSIGATLDWEMSLTGRGEPELVRAGLVTGGVFPTVGVKPFLGRTIAESDATEDAEGVVVLSHALWQRKFGADPKAIGKMVRVGRDQYKVIGVMPRDFFVPTSRADLWLANPLSPTARGRYLTGIARLAPGITVERAQAEMDVIGRRTSTQHPYNINWGVIVVPAHEQVVGKIRRALLIVMAAVALLLLIGCVNIANLLLSRATARAKEMAVRAALGASRMQLIRQLLTESLVLATIAGVLGVVLAGWATMLLVRFTPEAAMLPRMNEIHVDGRVLAVTAILTLATGIIFGLAPALEASRTDLQGALKSASRGSSHDRRGKTFRNLLVVVEVALATMLLIGAGLLIKSFSLLENISPGVRGEGALTARIALTPDYLLGEARFNRIAQLLEAVRTVPGVQRAGAIATINMPFTNSRSNTDFRIKGDPAPTPGNEPSSDMRPIAGDYFTAMGMPLLYGRSLNERAITPDRAEFVVNEAFVRRYFRGRNALGRRIQIEWMEELEGEIVGVVGDVRAAGLATEPAPAIYLTYGLDAARQFTFIVRSTGDPRAVQLAMVKKLRSMDPLMPVSDVKTLEELISGTIARPRFNTTMLTLFAALGLLLASIGIYGVLSYSVMQRTHEMGIRMALGAHPRDVLRLVVRDGLKVGILGVIVGLIAAFFATRLLASLLYGVDASDPTVFASVAATLAADALIASYMPARRATRVPPMIALRPEA